MGIISSSASPCSSNKPEEVSTLSAYFYNSLKKKIPQTRKTKKQEDIRKGREQGI